MHSDDDAASASAPLDAVRRAQSNEAPRARVAARSPYAAVPAAPTASSPAEHDEADDLIYARADHASMRVIVKSPAASALASPAQPAAAPGTSSAQLATAVAAQADISAHRAAGANGYAPLVGDPQAYSGQLDTVRCCPCVRSLPLGTARHFVLALVLSFVGGPAPVAVWGVRGTLTMHRVYGCALGVLALVTSIAVLAALVCDAGAAVVAVLGYGVTLCVGAMFHVHRERASASLRSIGFVVAGRPRGGAADLWLGVALGCVFGPFALLALVRPSTSTRLAFGVLGTGIVHGLVAAIAFFVVSSRPTCTCCTAHVALALMSVLDIALCAALLVSAWRASRTAVAPEDVDPNAGDDAHGPAL